MTIIFSVNRVWTTDEATDANTDGKEEDFFDIEKLFKEIATIDNELASNEEVIVAKKHHAKPMSGEGRSNA